MGLLDAPASPARELFYSEYQDSSSVSGQTFTNADYSGGSAPVMIGLHGVFTLAAAATVELSAGIPGILGSTSGSGAALTIKNSAGTILNLAWFVAGVANQIMPLHTRTRQKLAAGTYTYYCSFGVLFVNAGVTCTLKNNTTPAWFRGEIV